jgi:hypothetical protein
MSENILIEIRDLLIEVVSLLKNKEQPMDRSAVGEKINDVVKSVSEEKVAEGDQKECGQKETNRETNKEQFTAKKLYEYIKENSIDDSCVFFVDEIVENLDENPVVVLTLLGNLVDDDRIIINNSCVTLLQDKEQLQLEQNKETSTISETVNQSDVSYLNNANSVELNMDKNQSLKEMLNMTKLSEISTELINSLKVGS